MGHGHSVSAVPVPSLTPQTMSMETDWLCNLVVLSQEKDRNTDKTTECFIHMALCPLKARQSVR